MNDARRIAVLLQVFGSTDEQASSGGRRRGYRPADGIQPGGERRAGRGLRSGEVGRESSWAGGGIVSPLYPWRYSPAVTALAHWSQDFYPQLGEHLFATTGIDPQVHTTGLYWLDLDDEAEALAWAERERRPLSAVDISAAYDAVPVLGPGFKRAIYMAGVANVRNPRLVKSLKAALLALPNVSLREHCQVTGFRHEGERVTGVQTADGVIDADEVVLSAGAWSGDLLRTLGLELPVEPVKGQMILFKCAEDFCRAWCWPRVATPFRAVTGIFWWAVRWSMLDTTRPRPSRRWKASRLRRSSCCRNWQRPRWWGIGQGCGRGRRKVFRISGRCLGMMGCGSIAGITAMGWCWRPRLASCSSIC